jgi:basic membrane protein A
MNGEAIDADWTGTLATGSVVLTDVNTTAAAEGTQEAIDAVKAELENGTRHVFDCSTFTVKGETLTSSKADVDTDPNYTPDTEAIVDGYFAESTFRSAPYFDLQIDGINLLDTNFGGFSIPNSRTASGSPAFLFHRSGFPGFFPVRPVL